jgi:hypothetical protein
MACSRPLQRDSSRSPADHRPHVGRSAGVPGGVGFLGNPPTVPSPVDTCAPARLRASWLRPPCHGPDGRAVMNRPACAGEHDTGLRRSASPCAAAWRLPRCAGFLGSVAESPADPLSPVSWPFGRRRSSASATPTSRRFQHGFTQSLSIFSWARGDSQSDSEVPPALPACGIDGQSLPKGICCQPDTWTAGIAPARRYRCQRSFDLSS